MKKKLVMFVASMVLIVSLAGAAFAHTPLFSCWDNGDETLSCEGGYSDGSSAAGTTIKVQDPKGKVIFTGKLDKNGELTFKKPKGEFTVTFDGGPGHSVTIKSSNIK